MSIIIFIVILALLILVHEFGHFIVAKKSGIRVDEFGLGFPPKIYSKKFGDTLYTLNAIPFGGFVKIFGEDPHSEEITEEDKPSSFFYKPKWIQALVLVAGVSFNVIFAWLLISFGYTLGLPSSVDESNFDRITDAKVVIIEVLDSLPANVSGLKPGDFITSISSGGVLIEGSNLRSEKIAELISGSGNDGVTIKYKRASDEERIVTVIPKVDSSDKKIIGIAMENIGMLKLPLFEALLEGAKSTYYLTLATVEGLAGFFWDTLRLQSDFSQVTGPIGIAGVVGEASALGFTYLLSLTALISINLAIINLLPFPALDGGRLLFVIIEAITRRPINPNFVRWANTAGFALLILLMIIVTGHDIVKLF